MEAIPGIAGVLTSFLTGRLVFRFFFEDASDFWDCFRFALRPDLFSLFKGEWLEDQFKSMKLSLYLLVTAGAGALVFFGLDEWLHSPNPPRSIEMPAERSE